jgi:hypothetical protein
MCFPFGLCGSQQSPMRLVRGCVPRIDHGAIHSQESLLQASGARTAHVTLPHKVLKSMRVIEPELTKHYGQVLVIGRGYGNNACEDRFISCGLEHQAGI